MIFNITDRGPFSTKILNVSSLSALPSGVKEGVMAIISDTKPNDVYVTNTQPSSAKTGDLWLYPSSAGKITYIHKGVAIVVGVVRQYDGSAWVAVPATQYKSGEWLSTTVYLLNGADDCTSVTGGWKVLLTDGEYGTVVRNEDNYYLQGGDGGGHHLTMQSVNKVDLTAYSKLKCDASFQPNSRWGKTFRVGVRSVALTESDDTWDNMIVGMDSSTEGRHTVTVDVTSIKTSGYIDIVNGGFLYVYKIWLEV